MKKLFVILFMAALASCGGNTGTEAPADSQSVKYDTLSAGNSMTTDTLSAPQ